MDRLYRGQLDGRTRQLMSCGRRRQNAIDHENDRRRAGLQEQSQGQQCVQQNSLQTSAEYRDNDYIAQTCQCTDWLILINSSQHMKTDRSQRPISFSNISRFTNLETCRDQNQSWNILHSSTRTNKRLQVLHLFYSLQQFNKQRVNSKQLTN